MDSTLATLLLEVKGGDADALIIATDYCDVIGNTVIGSRLEKLEVGPKDYIEAYFHLYGKQVAKAISMKEKEFCNYVRSVGPDNHLLDYLEITLSIELDPIKTKLFKLIRDPEHFEQTLGETGQKRFADQLRMEKNWYRMTAQRRTLIEQRRDYCHWLSKYKTRAQWSLFLTWRNKFL